MTSSARPMLLLLSGCVVLGVGVGVAMLLTADLGSDGYSTLVNGISIRTGLSFWFANLVVGVTLVALAAMSRAGERWPAGSWGNDRTRHPDGDPAARPCGRPGEQTAAPGRAPGRGRGRDDRPDGLAPSR